MDSPDSRVTAGLHGSLNRMTPAEFEAAYWESHP
jgi:transposase InsO family protein